MTPTDIIHEKQGKEEFSGSPKSPKLKTLVDYESENLFPRIRRPRHQMVNW